MPWNLLDNTNQGACAPSQEWVKIVMGNTQAFGIDSLGRLFTWGLQKGSGAGMSGHHGLISLTAPETYPHDPDTESPSDTMVTAKQIYNESGSPWIDVQSGEYAAIARNAKGELWIVGNVYYGLAGAAIGDARETGLFAFDNTSETWIRNGSSSAFTLIDWTQITNSAGIPYWNDFAMGWYHVLGLFEGSLYVWGINWGGNDFGDTDDVGVDEITYEPILIDWIPGNPTIKAIAANYSASAVVTSDDKIYWWGDSIDDGSAVSTPTLVNGLVIPVGETIEQIDITNASGMVVRLSDGSIWGNGYFNMPPSGTPSFVSSLAQLVQFPPSQHVEVEYFTLASLSRSGDIHAMGGFNYFLSRSQTSYNVTEWNEPYLVQADEEGDRTSRSFSIGVFYANALIDSKGRLATWGTNTYGMCALGSTQTEIPTVYVATLAAQAISWRGAAWSASEDHDDAEFEDQILLNAAYAAGMTDYLAIEAQLQPPHIPHWHKQLFDYEFFSDCWRPVVAIDESTVAYIACGNNMYNFMMLTYDMNANLWTILYSHDENSLFTCEMEGGAAIRGDVVCYHNWKRDVSLVDGDRFDVVFSAPTFKTWVVDNTSGQKTLNTTEWSATNQYHGRNKIACNDAGMVACIVEDASDWIVKVSLDFGVSWSDSKTLSYSANRLDFGVVINELNHIYIFYYDSVGNTITCEKSDDSGSSWSTQGTISSLVGGGTISRLECSSQQGELHLSVEDGLGLAEFYYSTNDGASWTKRDLPTGRLFYIADSADSSLYNISDEDEVDKFTEDYTDASPTFIDGLGLTTESVETIPTYGYLKNSGQYGVHANKHSLWRALGYDDYGPDGGGPTSG